VNGTKMNTTNLYTFDNQSTAVLRRWRHEGDETDIPRALYRTGYNWLRTASMLSFFCPWKMLPSSVSAHLHYATQLPGNLQIS
jgi:hypothetical protein